MLPASPAWRPAMRGALRERQHIRYKKYARFGAD
jgi:hypothetical protein